MWGWEPGTFATREPAEQARLLAHRAVLIDPDGRAGRTARTPRARKGPRVRR